MSGAINLIFKPKTLHGSKNDFKNNEYNLLNKSQLKIKNSYSHTVNKFSVANNATQIALKLNNLLGLQAPYVKVFVIRGIGYQADIVEDVELSSEFVYNRYLSLRVGHSFLINKPIPEYIGIKIHKKDRKLVIYGTNKEQVSNYAKSVYNLRPPSVYTGRGIRIKKGLHRRKLGKKDIRKGKV